MRESWDIARNGLAALALAVSPAILTGCVGFPTAEELKPQTAQEAYVEAEIAAYGIAAAAVRARNTGLFPPSKPAKSA